MTKYYKFLHSNLTHQSFTYTLGLNTDHIPFDTTERCSPGGLYFTTGENIWRFYSYGPKLAIIEIPEDAKVNFDFEGDEFKADKLIITKMIDNEAEILAEIGSYLIANPNKFSDVCADAAMLGHLEILKYARAVGWCEWDSRVCSYAALYGHIEILKYARENGCELDSQMYEFENMQSQTDEILKYVHKMSVREILNC